ncbi:hypothetical protein F4782DRAFT_520143 [Xylaria castorea]|nr:hypothetical protein F4782DRAFT_520143 [Xylaria castorea]
MGLLRPLESRAAFASWFSLLHATPYTTNQYTANNKAVAVEGGFRHEVLFWIRSTKHSLEKPSASRNVDIYCLEC